MNRREFLTASTAIAASVALPAIAQPDVFTLDKLKSIKAMLIDNAAMTKHNAYFAFIHSDALNDLNRLHYREKWKSAYRQYRKQKALGLEVELPAREILAKYNKKSPDVVGETGMFEGFRFITMDEIPA